MIIVRYELRLNRPASACVNCIQYPLLPKPNLHQY